MQKRKDSQKRNLIIAIVMILVMILGVAIYLNRLLIKDLFLAISYSAPENVASVREKIQLTDRANLIFSATHPDLEDRDDFNENCNAHTIEISVLGCYSDGKIHIYNIQSKELNGIVESTAAHELLHAVWERLDGGEKFRLTDYLLDIYNDKKYHDLLADDLGTYGQAERIDELHSRVGTEIMDLPEELEQHYAKYFKDQDRIVGFYENYISPFRELEAEIDALSSELEELNEKIEQQSQEYYARAEKFINDAAEFNSCANTQGCFASNYAFQLRRNELVSEQSNLDALFDETNELVKQYNSLVAEYNNNVIRGAELERVMNSNSEIEKKIDSLNK